MYSLKELNMKLNIICLAVVLNFICIPKVHAYLDPGTGSYIIQVTLGFLAAALYVLRIYWERLVCFFKGIKVTEDNNDTSSNITSDSDDTVTDDVPSEVSDKSSET